jgi:photosystem II stability/assembly factor-like uncharacterized protein
MSVEDRLRESLSGRAVAPPSSEDAWASIQRGIDRRHRRTRAIRIGGGGVLAAAFIAGAAWAGLALRSGHPVTNKPTEKQLFLSNVRVFGTPDFAKVGGVVTNNYDKPYGASVTCNLTDAAGKPVGTATGGLPLIRPGMSSTDQTIAFGSTKGLAISAACSATAIPPTRAPKPSPSPVPPATLQPASIVFFDADHGILGGTFASGYCSRRCAGGIEVTSDGGQTWTRFTKTPAPIVSVTVAPGTSDAWAVAQQPCYDQCEPTALLHSTDGGLDWTSLGNESISQPSFVSPTIGFALGYGRSGTHPLVATTDGGRTWQVVSRPCGSGSDLHWGEFLSFVTSTHGWILCNGEPGAGSQGRTVLETIDGGVTWQPIAGQIGSRFSVGGLGTSGYPGALAFRPDGTGWIGIGYAALYVMTSHDGGRHWGGNGTVPNSDGGEFQSLWFMTDSTGYALVSVFGGPEELAFTNDGGQTWTVVHRW